MSLAKDLLDQAHHLATFDKARPRQANLRRAISSAYYAAFHLLVASAADSLVPARPERLANRVSRAFQHSEMKQACNLFLRNPLPNALLELLEHPVSANLQTIALSFVELQEARHSADYDISLVLTRATVQARLADADDLFSAWHSIRQTEEANVFLSALAFASRWSR